MHAVLVVIHLFVAIGLISIPPTRCFLRWRRASRKQPFVPPSSEAAYARRFVAVELLLLVLLPFTAVLAARGVGML